MTAVVSPRVPAGPVVVHADADAVRWNRYVAGHAGASAYHAYEWRGIVSRAFGHETRYLTAETDAGVVGVLPLVLFRSRVFGRFAVSLPFLNYGGVLADSPQAEAALIDAAIREARALGASHLELRHTRQVGPSLQPRRHKVAMVLPLETSVEAQWQALDRKLRNQVRKAEKSGLTTVHGGRDLLAGFYDVFARNMRDLGTPVYGIRWFEEILQAFPDRARICAIRSGAQTVAASFLLWRVPGATIEVPWASALREFNPVCANVYLYWQMLTLAIERGFATFDFGRSTPGEGTFNFKKQWGAAPRELVWEYWTAGGALPDLSPKNPKFERAIRLWQRLPVGVTRVLGPHIVRNLP